MDRLAERELRRRDRYPRPLAIGLIDVDHFKEINDRYLLPGGDKVLVDLGKALASSLRTVDLLGRIGGEEFLVIAPETNMEGAMVLGERIRTTVENTDLHLQGRHHSGARQHRLRRRRGGRRGRLRGDEAPRRRRPGRGQDAPAATAASTISMPDVPFEQAG